MTQDEFDKLPPIPCTGDDLIVIDETNSISDNTVHPSQDPGIRKRSEEYLAYLKQYRPQEYEEEMKRRQSKP